MLQNMGKKELTSLKIKLNSLDPYQLFIKNGKKTINSFSFKQKKRFSFQVLTKKGKTWVYLIVEAKENKKDFFWESPRIEINLGKPPAKLKGLFALTKPYPQTGKTVFFEALVKGLQESQDLSLDFWAEDPEGNYKEFDYYSIKDMEKGDKKRYLVKLKLEKSGTYTIHAYLNQNNRRIDHELEKVLAEEDYGR